MTIGMFLDTAFPPDSRVENEAVSLIDQGHDVYLFSFNYDKRKKEDIINGIQVRRYDAGKLIYKLSALAYTFPFFRMLVQRKISHFIETVKPEVIHIHDMVLAEAVFKVNEKFNLPVVLDLHENRPVIMQEYSHLKTFPGKYLIDVRKWQHKQEEFIERANRVVLVTKEAKEEALTYKVTDKQKFVVLPNTIHLDIFKKYPIDSGITKRFKGRFNIVYTGDTGLRRGTDTAIEAINILKDNIPEIHLILVGRNTEDQVLKEMVNSMSLHGYVSFEGWQDVSLFPSYIDVADVCISPLKRNLHHDTTFANKIFQYMAMEKALLVSDCPAQENVILSENCGLIHEANNADDMADKIKRLYNDPELRFSLGKNAIEAVFARWNWDITKKELIAMYDSL
ncbi:glycosyltransferase family 4 protein [Fulvivirga sediminis]|uniref:Glycosyltransferase family 4 protein n=1 Tax=Fulvivirga sediminis TaxID=2803949 RepID=A0A937F7X7_9BACT|nr:glycosyltransferase family 4 protein [Fulvivirga sediminis]MBL3655638.1 glycosyltransferase family 4 protein [Fulvivirga sediminis]